MTESTTSESRLLVGRYRFDRLIGRGGMGSVWAAHDEMLGRDVAIKEVVPPPDLTPEQRRLIRERTLREARAAARIAHPSAVTVYDVVEDDGRPYIVMQLLPPRTLADVLTRTGPLPPSRVARIGLDLLDALETAHRAGVLHRDVKPANVLLAPDGRAVLTDFGIASVENDPTLTATGMLVGSPAYMPPERARGERPTPASDLWSLGATLFAAVEGEPPFRRDGQLPTLNAVLTEPVPPALHAGPLRPAIEALLSRDPSRRPTAAQTRELLAQALAASGRADRDAQRTAPVDVARTVEALPLPPSAGGPAPAPDAPPAQDDRSAQDISPTPDAPPAQDDRSALHISPAPDVTPARDAVPVQTPSPDSTAERPPVTLPAASPAPPERPPVPDPGAGRPPSSAAPRHARRRAVIATVAALVLLPAGAAALHVVGDATGGPSAARPSSSSAPGSAGGSPAPGSSSSSTSTTGSGGASSTSSSASRTGSSSGSSGASNGGSSSGSAVPAGFRRYTDPTGFSLAVPTSWRVSRSGTDVTFHPPTGRAYLLVPQTTSPRPDSLVDWQNQERAASPRFPGYQRLRLERVAGPKGWDVADWEFLWTPTGGTLHVLDRNLRVSDHRAYALYWSVPQEQWTQMKPTFDVVAASFRPAS